MPKLQLLLVFVLIILNSCDNKKTGITKDLILKDKELLDNQGNNIESTIDMKLQDNVFSLLNTQLITNKANSACAVVMDVKTGAIKALVNLYQMPDGSYSNDSNLVLNYYTVFGSNFNLYSAMALIEDGHAKGEDSIFVGNGSCLVNGNLIRDAHAYPDLKMTFKDGFSKSSNIVFAQLINEAYLSNPQDFLDHLETTNFNSKIPTDIAMNEYPKNNINKAMLLNSQTLQNISIGYEIKLTPLQILTYYNAIANNGIMMFPYFAKINQGKFKKRQVCKSETAKVLQSFLEDASRNDPFISSIKEPNYIAGKSGTINQSLGNNENSNYTSTYIGYFPSNNPQYTCLVMFNNPQNGNYYGSAVAGPVFKEITKFLR